MTYRRDIYTEFQNTTTKVLKNVHAKQNPIQTIMTK